MNRRDFLTLSVRYAMAAGMVGAIPAALLRSRTAHAETLAAGLSDPAAQPLFTNLAPNAMSAAFKYVPNKDRLSIQMGQTTQMTGLVKELPNGKMEPVATTVWGYGDEDGVVSWPGMTIERNISDDPLEIRWHNNLTNPGGQPLPHLLPVDTSFHWAYSLPGYEGFSIEQNGVPLVPHVHGGRNDPEYDGNPEYFFNPGATVVGPRYVTTNYMYGGPDWNDQAGMMWYHDHGLGITRLNVYAGLAGFFVVRDDNDTGLPGNPAGLPADPYELGYAIQDRMFTTDGELFYPAFPGDPAYADFIYGEGADLSAGYPEYFDLFDNPDAGQEGQPATGYGPTGLAEFFGDHIVVNGVIWPKARVERRQYRVRLLNGCDSRFMRLKLKVIPGGARNTAATDPADGYELPFLIIGSDQGLRETAAEVLAVDFMPGERLDLIIDFKGVGMDDRVILENTLGDAPFDGSPEDPDPGDLFPNRRTDRVMAFDVEVPMNAGVADTSIEDGYELGGDSTVDGKVTHTRKLALFEGTDEFGRLQPMLGPAEPVTDVQGNEVNGTLPWHEPITENPGFGDTEIWEIYNATGDAHPIHVHLVHFEVVDRRAFTADLVEQPITQHNGLTANGFYLDNIKTYGKPAGPGVSEQTRRDMVLARPGEVTRIKMTFDKAGRYVWHCHILSHEDHDMMRPMHVGPGPY